MATDVCPIRPPSNTHTDHYTTTASLLPSHSTKSLGGAWEWGFCSNPWSGEIHAGSKSTLLYTCCVLAGLCFHSFGMIYSFLYQPGVHQFRATQIPWMIAMAQISIHWYHDVWGASIHVLLSCSVHVLKVYLCTVPWYRVERSLFMYRVVQSADMILLVCGHVLLWLILGDESLIRWCWFGLEICSAC